MRGGRGGLLLLALTALSGCTQTSRPKEATCRITPDTVAFGRVPVGSFADRVITITNGGAHPVEGAIETACDGYSLVDANGQPRTGKFSLGPGEGVDVTLRFAPLDTGRTECLVTAGVDACSPVVVRGEGA